MIVEDGDSERVTRETVVPFATNAASPRVCIFAAFNAAYAPLADIARPNWAAYARRHGYAVRFYPHGFHLSDEHPKSYGDKGRFAWYYDLRGHCDRVVYLDIDSFFVNMNRPIGYEWYPFVWTHDDGGPQSGLWMADTQPTTEKHLRYAYEYAASENNVRHGVIEPHGISDQDAMTRLMHVPPFDRTFRHCYSAQEVGYMRAADVTGKEMHPPWIVHFGGLSFADKLAQMRDWSARVAS